MDFEAKLTSAGFLGNVDVAVDERYLYLRGPRAPYSAMRVRLVGQWLLFVVGLGALFAGQDWAIWMVLSAPVFSFAAYLWLWWSASEDTVAVQLGVQTEAATGWVFRWYDFVWLFNFITAVVLLTTASSAGKRTVSFYGPAPVEGSRRVRYVIQAPDPGRAAALTATLLGAAGSLKTQSV